MEASFADIKITLCVTLSYNHKHFILKNIIVVPLLINATEHEKISVNILANFVFSRHCFFSIH